VKDATTTIPSHGAQRFSSVLHQEVLITARHRGRGVAHPINTNLGIDRIQALFSHFGLD
jgi:hypothetical protein